MENGVWRTIRGRRVFIAEGESPIDAFKKVLKKPKDNILIETTSDYKDFIKNNKLINDNGTINKEVALLGTNPDRISNRTGNCQKCVPTYLERLRGNDVIANPLSGPNDKVYNDWYKLYKGVNSINDWTQTSRSSGIRQITNDIKAARDGAVFEIYIAYNQKSGQSGAHVFTGRNEKGKVIFENPQAVSSKFAFNRIDYITDKSIWGETIYLRIDDKELKDEYKNEIYRKR